MLSLTVPEMTCGHCRSTVEKAINQLDEAAIVTVDLKTHTVGIESEKSNASAIIAALKAAGYESEPSEI